MGVAELLQSANGFLDRSMGNGPLEEGLLGDITDDLTGLLGTDLRPDQEAEAKALLGEIALYGNLTALATGPLSEAAQAGHGRANYLMGIMYLILEEPENARFSFQEAVKVLTAQEELTKRDEFALKYAQLFVEKS